MNWIKIDPNEVDLIPDEPVWVYTLGKEVVFAPEGVEIPANYCSHYLRAIIPDPPKD